MSEFTIPKKQREQIASGLMCLGSANKRAVERLSNIAQAIQKDNLLYKSLFLERIADLMTGISKQSVELLISGPKGSGKSYSCLTIADKLSKILSDRTKGKHSPEDFFTLKNSCILSDPDSVNEVLQNSKNNQIILVDDAGATFSNRTFNDKRNQAFNRILSVCRTQRWCVLYTVPMKSQADLVIRQLSNFYGHVYKSNHNGGFNILKLFSVDVKEGISSSEMFSRKLLFDGKKCDFWIIYSPPKDLADQYDKIREKSAQKIINQGGSFTQISSTDKKVKLIKDLKKTKTPNFTDLGRKYNMDKRTIKKIYDVEVKYG